MKQEILDAMGAVCGASAVVVERSDRVRLIDRGGDRRFPAASLIKLYIMWALYKKINDGELKQTDTVDVKIEPIVGGCGILRLLGTENLNLTLKDIYTLMIVLSDNTAANILIKVLGADYINGLIQSKGFDKTLLGRMLMDSEARAKGFDNYTSANDILEVLKVICEDETISEQLRREMTEILKEQILTSHVAHNLPSDYSMAHKTGSLDATLHDAGIIYTPCNTYYFSVMLDEIPDIVQGKKLINAIGESIFEKIRKSEETV